MHINTLSNEIGSWDKLAQDASKYQALHDTALWLKQYEDTPFPVPDFVTATPERQCPVETTRYVVKSVTMATSPLNNSMLFNCLYCSDHDVLVLLPAESGLSDLAFEKGWRVVHPNLYLWEARKYETSYQLKGQFMTDADFYEVYLKDVDMDEDSAEFFGDIIRPIYEAESNNGAGPDADEEELDIEFSDPDREEETEE